MPPLDSTTQNLITGTILFVVGMIWYAETNENIVTKVLRLIFRKILPIIVLLMGGLYGVFLFMKNHWHM